jgi:hypothetical protein
MTDAIALRIVGATLTMSSLIAFIGAKRNTDDGSGVFYDDLGNKVDTSTGVTRLLIVLGLILLVNGVALILVSLRRRG